MMYVKYIFGLKIKNYIKKTLFFKENTFVITYISLKNKVNKIYIKVIIHF
jgi:hypothetical protein